MQARHRYENLLRAVNLANQNGEPYVPYDGEEMRILTITAAIDHVTKDTGWPIKGWTPYTLVKILELCGNEGVPYSTFLDNLKILIEDPAGLTIGVTVANNRKGFVVYQKNS